MLESVLVADDVLTDECSACAGNGYVVLAYYDEGEDDWVNTGVLDDCPKCDGSGRVARE